LPFGHPIGIVALHDRQAKAQLDLGFGFGLRLARLSRYLARPQVQRAILGQRTAARLW
jgi:hypothetical protein